MLATAINFPTSFLKESIFIFKGHTARDLILDFASVQDLEYHIANIREYMDWATQQDVFAFTEEIYEKVMSGDPLTSNEAQRFLSLCPNVCKVIDFIETDDALQTLKAKYPNALCR